MYRTPDQIRAWLSQNSYRMDLPQQYLGNEPNAVRRPWDTARVRWLLAASWPYEHAAGNQSIPAVYQSVHDASEANLCDRFYLPATPRDLRLLERNGVPAFGIESGQPLDQFDVVGTSISYLVLLMNFTKMLSMSGVPLRRTDREAAGLEHFPMVMIGGQAYSAPAAMEPVADCLWLGEVEDEPGNGGIGQVCDRIAAFKVAGQWQADRLECYKALAREFEYLHFPAFVRTHYRYEDRDLEHPSKQVSGYESLLPGMRFPRRSRKVRNMDRIEPLRSAPLLFSDPALGAGDLEVARGCPAWCSFCRLSWLTKPYRQRSVAQSVEHAQQWHRSMGAVELSPFSPDFPMYTRRKELVARLLTEVNDEADSVAMRVDDFIADNEYILLQAVGGMDAVTLGLEGNSQRMRDLVGKGTSDQDVIEAVTRGIRAGLRKFKLFMITNLPGEEPADVMRIVALARKLAAIRDELGQQNVLIQFSWTPLLIEAGTPFQWFAPTPPDHTLIEVADLFKELKIAFKIGVKAEPNKVAFFQLCQRASAEVGEAIVDVLADLDTACWGGVPRDMRERLDAALLAHGFANGFADCFDERYEHDLFGWEYLDTGVAVSLMWSVYQQMAEFLERTEADTYEEQFDPGYHGNEWVGRCDTNCLGNNCGACKGPDLKLRADYIRAGRSDLRVDLTKIKPIDQSSVVQRVRTNLWRPEAYRWVGDDHWRFSVRRAAYMSGVPIAKRSIRFASDGFADRGVHGADVAEFGLTQKLTRDSIMDSLMKMQDVLSEWAQLSCMTWLRVPPGSSTLRRDAAVALYDLPVQDDPEQIAERLRLWREADNVPLTIHSDKSYFGVATEVVNAKDYADDMWLVLGRQPVLRLYARGQAGPYQLYAALMGRVSAIQASALPVERKGFYVSGRQADALQEDLLAPPCTRCGLLIPVSVLGMVTNPELCPRCEDEATRTVMAGVALVPAV